MANPNNRFLTEKDRKKAENDTSNIYKQRIDEIMRGNMAAEWQPSNDNNIKRLPAAPSVRKVLSGESQKLIYDMKKKDEEKRFSQQKAEEEARIKKSNNPYVRNGKQTLKDYEERTAKHKKDYEAAKEKYPILKQSDAVFSNTIKPATEGMLKAAGDTVGELVTNKYVDKTMRAITPDIIQNKDAVTSKEGKENLRNYLSEREKAQHGIGKVAYKTGEIGTNLALMSSVSNKLPFIGKLDTLTKSKFVNKALREGVENALIGGVTDFAKGDTEDFAMNRLKDFGGGAAFGVAMEGIGRLGKKAGDLLGGKAQNIPYNPPKVEPTVEPRIEPEVIEPIKNFEPTKQMNLLNNEVAPEQLDFKEHAGVKTPQVTPRTKRPVNQAEGQTTLFDNEPKMNDNEQLNILDQPKEEVPIKEIPRPLTNTIPKPPTKYELNNPSGKMKPHVVGGDYKVNEKDIHINDRQFDNVGNRKINAMSYEHPEMREYVEAEAHALKGEVERTIKGGKGQLKNESGIIVGGTRQTRVASEDVKLMRNSGMSYKDIDKGIDDIIADHGRENSAAAKRVELVIDDRLSKGYTEDIYGEFIPPVENYISTKNQVYGKGENYSKIPKMAEREKILERFNQEYGHIPSQQPPQPQNTTRQVNIPQQTKTLPQANNEVFEGTLSNVYSPYKADYSYNDVYEGLVDRVNPDYQPDDEVIDNIFTNIYPPIKEKINKPVDNVKKIPTNVDEETLLEQLKNEPISNSGKKIKLEKFGECEIVEETDGQIRLKNARGTEFTIGEAALEKLKINEKVNTPPPMPNQKKNTKVEPKPSVKAETAYTSLGDTAVSKMRTNTYANAEFMQDEQAKKVVDRISGEYEVLHDKELIESSKIKLEEDFSNTYENLIKKANGEKEGLMNAEDITQAAMITNKLIQDSKVSGDTEALKSWLKKIRIQATSLGQAVHSISTWKKQTPEGMMLVAQKTIDKVVDEMKVKNPKKVAVAERMAEETKVIVNDIVNKIQQTEPKKPIEEILVNPSATVTKIINEATSKIDNKIIKDEINSAIENKTLKDTLKISERVLERNGVPSLTDSDIKFITEKMEKIQTLTDSRQKDIEFALVKKLIAEKIPPTLKDKLKSIQMINLLLNTKTNIKNIVGNGIMSGLENAKDIVATPIDKAISKFTGQRTTTIPSITEQLKGFVKGAKEGWEDAKLGIDTSKMSGRYSELETNKMYDIPKAQAFRKIENPKTVIEHLNNLASRSEKLTGTLLSMGDRPFFEAAFSGSLAQQLKLNGGEVTEEMVEKAIKDAEERTFQNVNELTQGMQWIKTGMNKIGKKVTGTEFNIGDIALPFVKTPANILSKAIDYSPIGGVQGFAKIVKGIKTGALDQKAAVDQLARGLTGTSLIFAGYELAKNGVIYGKGSKDTDVKALEKQAGKLPYSIKSGDTYTTIDWIQPAAIPLMIGADIYEQKKTDKEAQNIILNAVTSGGKTLFDQSLLTGLTELFGGYGSSGGEKVMEGVKRTALNGLTQFLPYGSALNQITKLTDSNVRNTYDENTIKSNLVNRSQAKIPFKSEELPKKYSTVGQEIKQNYGAKGLANAFQTLINPATTSKFNPTPAEKLALDIYERSGEVIQMPRVVDKTIRYYTDNGTKNGKREDYNLNGREQSELQRLMGEKTEAAFSEISKTSKFESMTDQEKAAELQKLMTKIKAEAEKELLDKKQIKYKK